MKYYSQNNKCNSWIMPRKSLQVTTNSASPPRIIDRSTHSKQE